MSEDKFKAAFIASGLSVGRAIELIKEAQSEQNQIIEMLAHNRFHHRLRTRTMIAFIFLALFFMWIMSTLPPT